MKHVLPGFAGLPFVLISFGLAPAGCLGGQTGQPTHHHGASCDDKPLETLGKDELRSFVAKLEGSYSAPLHWHDKKVHVPTVVEQASIERKGSIEFALRYVGTDEPSGRCGISLPFEVTVSTDDGSFDGSYLTTVSYNEDFDGSTHLGFPRAADVMAADELDDLDEVPYGAVLVDDELALELPTQGEFFSSRGVQHQDDCAGNESEIYIEDGELFVTLCLDERGLATAPFACGGVAEMSYEAAIEAGLGLPGSSGTRLTGEGEFGLSVEIELKQGADFCLTRYSEALAPGRVTLSLGDESIEVESHSLSPSNASLWSSEGAADSGEQEFCLAIMDETRIEGIETSLLAAEVLEECSEGEEFICERSQMNRDDLLSIIEEGVESVELCPSGLWVSVAEDQEEASLDISEVSVILRSTERAFWAYNGWIEEDED